MQTDILLQDIETYVRDLFEQHQQPYLFYHNLEHTRQVVAHTAEIAAYYKLEEERRFVVMTAAWFHDTGHLVGDMATHEQRSMELMVAYLSPLHLPASQIVEISRCIMATRMPVHPVFLLERIICDADTYHLGTDDFAQLDELVWQEMEARLGTRFDDHTARSIAFLQTHQYYTAYCQQLLTEGKNKNLRMLVARAGVE